MNRSKAAILGVLLLALALTLFLVPATASAETATANLVFIHHSVGGAWLSSGLRAALNANNIHVADTNYGWTGGSGTDYGSYTDTADWPDWFNGTVMPLVYAEMEEDTGNTIHPAAGGNTIVMFKSCYPNSDVGSDISDEKAIYNGLLPYFRAHPDKMFVLVTPPPMRSISDSSKTRELCNWLTDRQNGWLKGLTTKNVFTFDLYNVLTHPNAHHYIAGGVESHVVVPGANTLYYPTGDDHPNEAGNDKATAEFVPLLKAWYAQFKGAPIPPAATLYQQTDTRLTYLGAWTPGYTSLASGGSFCSSDGNKAAVLVNFKGTSIQVLARKAPWYGKALVSIDGGTATVVDLYSASTLYKKVVYSKTGLTNTAHTMVIKRLGQKNTSATGYAISLDALQIVGSLTQAVKTTAYQQDNAKVRYAGTWTTAYTASASGGSYASGNVLGAKITLTFNGTYLTWFAKTAPWYGKATVTLDGGTPATVDLYSSAQAFKKQVYNTGLLANKSHTLVIQWMGARRAGSLGTAISADAFGVLGSLY
jgi:hypothetical protein